MTESIPKEALIEWMNDPITKRVMAYLREVRTQHQEVLLEGRSLNMRSCEETALQTAQLLGKIAGMNLILEMHLEED